MLRHNVSSHHNSPLWSELSTAAGPPALFSCLWHESLADGGVSIEGQGYLAGFRGYSVIPCIPRARRTGSVSFCPYAVTREVREAHWVKSLAEIAVDNASNRCTTKPFLSQRDLLIQLHSASVINIFWGWAHMINLILMARMMYFIIFVSNILAYTRLLKLLSF